MDKKYENDFHQKFYKKYLINAFRKAIIWEKISIEEPEIIEYIEMRNKNYKAISPIIAGFIGVSVLAQYQIFYKWLGKGYTFAKFGYYTIVLIGCTKLLTIISSTPEIESKALELGYKYENYLLEIDPDLKNFHRNFYRSG
jgi:hypothetical protein